MTLADIGVPDLGCAHPPLTVQLGDYCTLRFHIRSAEVVYYMCEIRNSTLVMIDRFKFCLPEHAIMWGIRGDVFEGNPLFIEAENKKNAIAI